MTRVNKTSGALRCAKAYLWDGTGALWHQRNQFPFICAALAQAYENKEITYKTLINTRSVIMRRLSPSVSVSEWLDENIGFGYKYYNLRDHAFWTQQIQAYRHRWVDALIIEFETKGD